MSFDTTIANQPTEAPLFFPDSKKPSNKDDINGRSVTARVENERKKQLPNGRTNSANRPLLDSVLPRLPIFSSSLGSTKFEDWKLQKYSLGLHSIAVFLMKKQQVKKLLENLTSQEKTSPLQEATLEILTLLFESLGEESRKPFEHYQKFIDILRKALNLKEYNEELIKKKKSIEPYDSCVDIFLWICWARFCEVNIYPLAERVVSRTIQDGFESLGKTDPLKKVFEYKFSDQFEGIEKGVEVANEQGGFQRITNKTCAALGIGFDPHRWHNMPNVAGELCRKDKEKICKIKLLRFGTPTLQRTELSNFNWSGTASIIPEMQGFIDILSTTRKKFLYIGLQDYRNYYFNGEYQRCEALKELHLKNKDTFIFINFSQDSPFYHQSESSSPMTTELFSDKFLSEHLGENTGYWFAENVKENFPQKIREIFNFVHYDIFHLKKELSLEERMDFIEISQVYIALFFSISLNVDLLGFHCRDSKDRGAKNSGLFQSFVSYLVGKGENLEEVTKIMVNTHAPALLSSQEALNMRRLRFISAMNRFKDDETKSRILERNKMLGYIDPIDVEKWPTLPQPQE
jgi:hypothetical protein